MASRKLVKKYKNQIMVGFAVLLAILMLVPAWMRGSSGGTAVTLKELKEYVLRPSSSNQTLILLFVAPPKECPICPQVLNNVTSAINILESSLAKNLNTTVKFEVLQCANFPQCTDKRARINVIWYKVSQVPIIVIVTNRLEVPIDPTGLGPQRLARLIAAWITVLKHAWLPPPQGKYVLYFYDGQHKSALIDTIKSVALQKGYKFIAMGCASYPTNCTNVTVFSTMTLLGIRPQNLPLVMVIKDGRVVTVAQPTTFENVDKILKALQS